MNGQSAIVTGQGQPSDGAKETSEMQSLLDATARIPQHVVYRDFMNETVVLNLESGKYHGLNPIAGRMLQALEKGNTLRAAAAVLAAEYGVEVDEVANDICALCSDLEQRGLVELVRDDAR
jgi:coenzyme PQQ synthesis protein D (PqqD)